MAAALRTEVARRITAVLPGSTGGVAAALIAGKRGAIDEAGQDAFRNSGLSHLLAIAGLHLGLVGAFRVLRGAREAGADPLRRAALADQEDRRRRDAHRAVLLSDAVRRGDPDRARLCMNGIVFAAILIDRLRLSMRICAIAAVVVLLLEPESLAGVSFQMSFGAVVALIAVYETWGRQLGRLLRRGSWRRKRARLCRRGRGDDGRRDARHRPVLDLPLPPHRALFAARQCDRGADLGAVWTLPWGRVACLLMPFGLERLALVPMGWGIDATIWVAEHVSAIPGNVWPTPRLPMGGLVIVAFGGLWLCLWQGRWRRWGWIGIAAGMATMFLTRPPDIVIADFGRFVAARAASGDYYVLGGNDERIAKSLFAEETGARAAALAGGRHRVRRSDLQRRCLPSIGRAARASRSSPTTRGLPLGLRRGRRDRQPGAGGVCLPQADPGRRPHRQSWRAARSRCGSTPAGSPCRRERQPRRPTLGAAPGIGKERAAANAPDSGFPSRTTDRHPLFRRMSSGEHWPRPRRSGASASA